MDNHIIGGSYDDERKAIIFRMRDGTECRLKAQSILQIYRGLRTDSAIITVENYIDAKNVIRGDIRVSNLEGNQLSINDDGIYTLPPTTHTDMFEGEMYIINGEYVVPSGISITSLATEEYVMQMKQDVLDFLESCSTTHLKTDQIVQEISDNPSTDMVPSVQCYNDTFKLRRM